MNKMQVLNTDDYHEDFGNCLFFHFGSFGEPPEVYCGSVLDGDFDEDYWNYFTRDCDFNSILEQAERLDMINSSECDSA